jgi:hypothetical protein
MVNTTRKVPAAPDAIPTVDRGGPAFRPQRAGHTHVGGVTKQGPPDVCRQPAAQERYAR